MIAVLISIATMLVIGIFFFYFATLVQSYEIFTTRSNHLRTTTTTPTPPTTAAAFDLSSKELWNEVLDQMGGWMIPQAMKEAAFGTTAATTTTIMSRRLRSLQQTKTTTASTTIASTTTAQQPFLKYFTIQSVFNEKFLRTDNIFKNISIVNCFQNKSINIQLWESSVSKYEPVNVTINNCQIDDGKIGPWETLCNGGMFYDKEDRLYMEKCCNWKIVRHNFTLLKKAISCVEDKLHTLGGGVAKLTHQYVDLYKDENQRLWERMKQFKKDCNKRKSLGTCHLKRGLRFDDDFMRPEIFYLEHNCLKIKDLPKNVVVTMGSNQRNFFLTTFTHESITNCTLDRYSNFNFDGGFLSMTLFPTLHIKICHGYQLCTTASAMCQNPCRFLKQAPPTNYTVPKFLLYK